MYKVITISESEDVKVSIFKKTKEGLSPLTRARKFALANLDTFFSLTNAKGIKLPL